MLSLRFHVFPIKNYEHRHGFQFHPLRSGDAFQQRARKKGSFLLLIHRLRRRERFFRFRCLILDAKDEGNFLISLPQGASPPFSVVKLSRKKSNYLCQKCILSRRLLCSKGPSEMRKRGSKRLSSTFQ